MRLMQVRGATGGRAVVATEGNESWTLPGVESVYSLALAAARDGARMVELVLAAGRGESVDPRVLFAEGRVLTPIEHPDPAHTVVSGTGLTHLGSAAARDAMHKKLTTAAETESLTDSMKMFRLGLEGGKPPAGSVGIQPEWFYKGDGSTIAAPGAPLVSPPFADDAGEEPEVAGIYVIAEDGTPLRIGFALCNEFSDHVMERQNYLWLAHSKLRPCGLGPELLLGDLPESVEGVSRIRRGGETIFEKPFLTGEANMSHTIENLEAHHFKYAHFRRPGDVHVHSFGTATVSFAEGMKLQEGDVFEIESPLFGLPQINSLTVGGTGFVRVRPV
jgi:hypothetical protein